MESIKFEDFSSRTGIPRSALFREYKDAEVVVGLRELSCIDRVLVMPKDYLATLLGCVPLLGSAERPYEHSSIETLRMDPRSVKVAQTFVERKKCLNFLEQFSNKLTAFCLTNGAAKCTSFIAYGTTVDGKAAIAHYVPPIIEKHEELFLVDGTHRNWLVMTIGTTLEVVVVSDVRSQFPCTPVSWDQVRPVDSKPPKYERHINLRETLFRDLKFIGIDG